MAFFSPHQIQLRLANGTPNLPQLFQFLPQILRLVYIFIIMINEFTSIVDMILVLIFHITYYIF